MIPAPDWVALRRALLLERGPLCEICNRQMWTETNHCLIHSKRKPEAFYRAVSVMANLQAVCSICHNPRGHTRANKLAFAQKQRERGYDLVSFVDSVPAKDKDYLYRLVG